MLLSLFDLFKFFCLFFYNSFFLSPYTIFLGIVMVVQSRLELLSGKENSVPWPKAGQKLAMKSILILEKLLIFFLIYLFRDRKSHFGPISYLCYDTIFIQ